jgi:hypothetical protein
MAAAAWGGGGVSWSCVLWVGGEGWNCVPRGIGSAVWLPEVVIVCDALLTLM